MVIKSISQNFSIWVYWNFETKKPDGTLNMDKFNKIR